MENGLILQSSNMHPPPFQIATYLLRNTLHTLLLFVSAQLTACIFFALALFISFLL
jgi:hypothetical protein